MVKPGWLRREMDDASKNVLLWPEWELHAAGWTLADLVARTEPSIVKAAIQELEDRIQDLRDLMVQAGATEERDGNT